MKQILYCSVSNVTRNAFYSSAKLRFFRTKCLCQVLSRI